MKLGINIGYSGAQLRLPVELVQQADRLGYDSVWTAEAYGSDAVTPLAYLAAKTERIKLGTAIMQLAGRTPAMTAMTMSTLDALSGGRALCGLGLSGPQVVEGWHGVPFRKPGAWMREYVQVLRQIWGREQPAQLDGEVIHLPNTGPGTTGLGKPLKSILHGRQLPIYLGAMGDGNVRTAGELCDGILPGRFSPYQPQRLKELLEEGFDRAGNGKSFAEFDIAPSVRVIVGDDVGAALAQMKPQLALYIGGMGAREKNFHNENAVRLGYGEAAARIQELYLAGRKEEAEAAVPDELCDEISLCGPPARIRERYRAWEDAGVGTLVLQFPSMEALHLIAEVAGLRAAV